MQGRKGLLKPIPKEVAEWVLGDCTVIKNSCFLCWKSLFYNPVTSNNLQLHKAVHL